MFPLADQQHLHKSTLRLPHADQQHHPRSRLTLLHDDPPGLPRIRLMLLHDDLRHPLKTRLMLLRAATKPILKIRSVWRNDTLHLLCSKFNPYRPSGLFNQIHVWSRLNNWLVSNINKIISRITTIRPTV
jgi:hypothetical protein